MTIEQLYYAVWFILAVALAIAVAYYTRRRQVKFPVAIATTGLLFVSISTSIIRSFEGDAIGIFFLWLSCILGLSLALDILTYRGKELNEKLMVSSWLVVTGLGGILTNVYIFSVPTSFVARILSLSMLILVHVPIVFALIAYLVGRRKFSKKLVNFGYLGRYENEA